MRAAAILGLGCSPRQLRPFQDRASQCAETIDWQMGMPASADAADVILLFGGDGTIHRHLGPLVELGLPVLIVPAGSGNDFARAVGLRRVRDSLAAWRKFCAGAENVRALDLGVISSSRDAGEATSTVAQGGSAPHDLSRDSQVATRYFCCVASVGLDAEVSRRANALPRWLRGHGGYALALIPTIFGFAPLPMKILTPAKSAAESSDPISAQNPGAWTPLSDPPTILAAFANTPTYGGGMKIAPQAKMDDGLLDVCVVGAVDPFKLLRLFPTVYTGRHLKSREVQYSQAACVRVETEHPLDVYADGEFVCHTPVEIGIQRAALRIVTPCSSG
jgi:diacylglycerol kinase (ATP)